MLISKWDVRNFIQIFIAGCNSDIAISYKNQFFVRYGNSKFYGLWMFISFLAQKRNGPKKKHAAVPPSVNVGAASMPVLPECAKAAIKTVSLGLSGSKRNLIHRLNPRSCKLSIQNPNLNKPDCSGYRPVG